MLTVMKGPGKKPPVIPIPQVCRTCSPIALSTVEDLPCAMYRVSAMGDTDVNKTLSSASKGLLFRGRGQTYPQRHQYEPYCERGTKY